MNQSGCSMQSIIKRTMYKHNIHPTGGCHIEFSFNSTQSRYLLNIQFDDDKCLMWNIIAHLHLPCEVPYECNQSKKLKRTE